MACRTQSLFGVVTVATLISGSSLFAACSSDSNPKPIISEDAGKGAGGKKSDGAGGAGGGSKGGGSNGGAGGGSKGGGSNGGAGGGSKTDGGDETGGTTGDGGEPEGGTLDTHDDPPRCTSSTSTTDFLNAATTATAGAAYDDSSLPNVP